MVEVNIRAIADRGPASLEYGKGKTVGCVRRERGPIDPKAEKRIGVGGVCVNKDLSDVYLAD